MDGVERCHADPTGNEHEGTSEAEQVPAGAACIERFLTSWSAVLVPCMEVVVQPKTCHGHVWLNLAESTCP